jgi:hypothetical protein
MRFLSSIQFESASVAEARMRCALRSTSRRLFAAKTSNATADHTWTTKESPANRSPETA